MKVTIDRWIYGGAGVGTASADGTVLSLPFSIPGEVFETDGAERNELITASPERAAPRCPHFRACGGCQYQHAEYGTQVRLKAAILSETLEATGLNALPELQIHTAEPWEYRNRIRLRVGFVDGALRVGYNRRGSYAMLPILECPIASPLLMRAAKAILSTLESTPALTTWASQITEVELFANSTQSRLQMTLFLRSDRGDTLTTFCDQLKENLPEIAGAGVIVVGASGKKEQPGAGWGADGLQYRAAGKDYWVSRGSFFQVNRFLVDELVHLVTRGRMGRLAWDLYAGVGLFSRALAESFPEVVGVETVIGDLAAVLKGNGKRAVGATTAEFLRHAVLQRERPDLIVMDPPRTGLGAEVCTLLARIATPQMVYVSCDPQTLAHDLKAMVDSGYTINEVHMVDLFPQTFHMETVVVLSR